MLISTALRSARANDGYKTKLEMSFRLCECLFLFNTLLVEKVNLVEFFFCFSELSQVEKCCAMYCTVRMDGFQSL